MSSAEYLSIEQVAQRLQLHVRTVRSYVRSGRLKAVRVGKQYRIAPEDLTTFTGPQASALPTDKALCHRKIEMIGIVQIDVIGPVEAESLSNTAKSLAIGWLQVHNPLSFLRAYDGERKQLKLVIAGDLNEVVKVVEAIQLLAGSSGLPPPRGVRPAPQD